MPQADDIVKIVLVQELAGVQMANVTYWKLADLGDDPTVNDALTEFMTEWANSVKAALSPAWALVCGIYENITTPDVRTTVFSTITGTGAIDSHPQDQVVRLNRYAFEGPAPGKNHRGSMSISGCIESLSTRGRLNDTSAFQAFRTFMSTQQIMPGPSWTMNPTLRVQVAPGPPAVYAYHPITDGQITGRLFKLAGRKTELCAAG